MDQTCEPYPITDDVWMVPCLITNNNLTYVPQHKPFTVQKPSPNCKNKNLWSSQEDQLLQDLILVKKCKSWSSIAKEINLKLHKGAPFKIGKQCRERWANHLDPKLNKQKWTKEEDEIIIQTQVTSGNRWSEISKLLVGRTENQVKNRWKSLMSKIKKESSEPYDANIYMLTMMAKRSDSLLLPPYLSTSAVQLAYKSFSDGQISQMNSSKDLDSTTINRTGSERSEIDMIHDFINAKIEENSIHAMSSFCSELNFPLPLGSDLFPMMSKSPNVSFFNRLPEPDGSTLNRIESVRSEIDHFFGNSSKTDNLKKEIASNPKDVSAKLLAAKREMDNLIPSISEKETNSDAPSSDRMLTASELFLDSISKTGSIVDDNNFFSSFISSLKENSYSNPFLHQVSNLNFLPNLDYKEEYSKKLD